MEKLLVDAKEARSILDVGEKLFRSLNVTARWVGKRKKYHVDDLKEFARTLEKTASCPSLKDPVRRTGNTTSRSKAIGFEEALRRTTKERPERLNQSSAPKPSLAIISRENRV
jgi:hypothetical protein